MDARKKNVLLAVVEAYIQTGEPVGSKMISQLPQIHVSAATVRNDMAVLEELGYLEQPHTSAGRVPTYSGYRFYIDEVVEQGSLSDAERKRLDAMLGDESQLTEDLILQSATIKNKACRLEFDLTEENMQFFRNFMEENLHGVSISDLSEERMEQMITAVSAYMMALSPLVQGVCEMSRDLQKNKVYVSGEQNLLSCQDLNQAEVVQFISHKNELRGLLDDSFKGVKVVFGEEGDRFVIGNSSMIVSKYQKGEQAVGSLGIIGPMRLDYAKIIPYIEYFTEKLSHLISEEDDEADNE